MMDVQEIKRYLPHRYPFLLVDRILEIEKFERVVGIKNVSLNEYFFKGHFPDRPIMPGVLIVEAMAQVGGVLYAYSLGLEGNNTVYFMGIDKCKFRKLVVPGDQIRIEMSVLRKHRRGWKMRGEAYVEGKLAVEAEMLALLEQKSK
jgi:beta-hydroxyacyl-ACP dehydratase FabZ